MRNELHSTGPVKDFKRVRNLIVYKIRCSCKQYGSKIISKIYKSNPRKFHDLVQNIIGKKATRVEVRDVYCKPLLPSEMNYFFASIYKIHLQLRKLPPNDSVSNIHILEICLVAKKLKALDSRKSSYPSEIPIKLIIEYADLLYTPLTAIFNLCFIDGVFPCIFKQAYVTPIPKCKAPKNITDMRPISKTPALSKYLKVLFSIVYLMT